VDQRYTRKGISTNLYREKEINKYMKKVSLLVVAALAATTFATSANAAPLVVTVAGSANSTTATAPATANVPADNSVDAADAVALVATADTATVVSFVAAGGVKLVTALATASSPVLASAGTTSYSVTSAGAAVTVYAFTTGTATGSVTITNGAYSTVVYVKGIAGAAYNVGVSVPSTTAVGTIPSVSVNITDVFGNAVGGETVTATLVGATWADLSISKSIVTSTAAQVTADATLTLGAKAEKLAPAVAGTVTVAVTGASSATAVTGLAAPVKSAVATFAVTDLNGTITALNAQVASLTAQLAAANAAKTAAETALAAEKAGRANDSATATTAAATAKAASDLALATAKATYKAQYNALAKKWNLKNPKAKVALIK
jgi:uncharacterized small protein (DUF1192 family)